MPSRPDLEKQIRNPNIQDTLRRNYLKKYSDYVGRDVILYASAYTSRKFSLSNIPQFFISLNDEDIQGFMSANQGMSNDKLDLILHSPGGSPNSAQQIVSYLRQRYKHIRAVVPQNAMSAATMIACACDEIIMAKHSAIGPIDPQIGTVSPDGLQMFIPARSIIEEFDKAKSEVIQHPELATLWFTRINSYPTGFYAQCENLLKNSREIVEQWLLHYMFENKKEENAKCISIAKFLSEHKDHGTPINCETAQSIGLKIIPLENDQTLQENLLSIFHTTMITFDITKCVKIIENHEAKGFYVIV